MSMLVAISISGPGLGVPAELLARLAPARLAPVAGEAGAKAIRTHLRGLAATRRNALGAPSTRFYGRAVQAVEWSTEGDIATVRIAGPRGIAQRFYGGTIRPTGGRKYLTIPVAPEAHGKRAREFGDLQVVWSVRTKQPIGLSRGGRLYYIFKRSVTQRPDPTVLPPPAETGAAIGRALRSHLLTKPSAA